MAYRYVGGQVGQQLPARRRRRQDDHAVERQRVAQLLVGVARSRTPARANVAQMWMMPPSSAAASEGAPVDLAQPTGQFGLRVRPGVVRVIGSRSSVSRAATCGAPAVVHDGGHAGILHGENEHDPAAASARQPVAGPGIARQRDHRAAVGLAHGGAGVEGMALGGVGDQPALAVEDGKAPPGGREVVHEKA